MKLGFSESPKCLESLAPPERAALREEVLREFSHQFLNSLYVYPIELLCIWWTTGYFTDYPRLAWTCSIVMLLGLCLRCLNVVIRQRTCAFSEELWMSLNALTVLLVAGGNGLLLAHSMLAYGFTGWTFIVIMIWAIAVAPGALITFLAAYRLLILHIMLLLTPALFAALKIGGPQAGAYAAANCVLMVFSMVRGRRLFLEYWKNGARPRVGKSQAGGGSCEHRKESVSGQYEP